MIFVIGIVLVIVIIFAIVRIDSHSSQPQEAAEKAERASRPRLSASQRLGAAINKLPDLANEIKRLHASSPEYTADFNVHSVILSETMSIVRMIALPNDEIRRCDAMRIIEFWEASSPSDSSWLEWQAVLKLLEDSETTEFFSLMLLADVRSKEARELEKLFLAFAQEIGGDWTPRDEALSEVQELIRGKAISSEEQIKVVDTGLHHLVEELSPALSATLKGTRTLSDQMCGVIRSELILETWDIDWALFIVESSTVTGNLNSFHGLLYGSLTRKHLPLVEAMDLLGTLSTADRTFMSLPKFFSRMLANHVTLGDDIMKPITDMFGLVCRQASILSGLDDDRATLQQSVCTTYLAIALVDSHARRLTGLLAPKNNSEAYVILGLELTADADEIKAAYRSKVQQWHPDRLDNMAPELKAFANEQLARINVAYEELRIDG